MRLLLYTKCHLRNSIFLWTLTRILHNIHSHLLINNLAKLNTYRSIPLVTYTGDTSAFENYSVNLPNRSFYEFELFMSVSHPTLGGGRYLVTGLKFTDPNQEIQQFISYANNSIKIYYRSKIGGVWGNFFAK